MLPADCGFRIVTDTQQEVPVLSCIDMTMGRASSCIIPQKGVGTI